MSLPGESPEMTPERLRQESTWPAPWRGLAIVLWSGFLGSILVLLAVLMGWETLQSDAESPGFALLGGVFAIGWLISSITSLVALSLAKEPKPRIGAQD